MTNFIKTLNKKHKESIKAIKQMIDVEAQEYDEYRAAATLCRFIYDSEDRYLLIQEAEKFAYFYQNANDFEILCNNIYHSLTDDGDIAFVKVNSHCPRIIFRSRWDIKIEDLVSKHELDMYSRLNKFKKQKRILPLHENKMVFFDDVYSYIAAVEKYRIDFELESKQFEEWKRKMSHVGTIENE
jgi:hypothetical protein